MSDESQAASSRRMTRALGTIGQAVGVLGALISVVLAVVVLLGCGRVVDRLDEMAARIDAGIARGVPLLAAARERVEGTSALVGALGDAVAARAGTTGTDAEGARVLLEKTKDVSDRYLEIRASYADARKHVVSALDRLNTIDDLIPALRVPQGPVETLAALDERVRLLDANVMGLLSAVPEAGTGPVVAAILEKVGSVKAALTGVSAGLGDTGARLQGLQERTAASANRIHTLVTVATVALVAALLYASLLHAVLYREGRRMRRGATGP